MSDVVQTRLNEATMLRGDINAVFIFENLVSPDLIGGSGMEGVLRGGRSEAEPVVVRFVARMGSPVALSSKQHNKLTAKANSNGSNRSQQKKILKIKTNRYWPLHWNQLRFICTLLSCSSKCSLVHQLLLIKLKSSRCQLALVILWLLNEFYGFLTI